MRWIFLYANITVCRISCPMALRFITKAFPNVAYHPVECQDNDRRGLSVAHIFPWTLAPHTAWIAANRPVAQIPQCTSSITHNAQFCNRNMHIHVCTFLLQNGASWDICLMHCGICEIGLLRMTCSSMNTLRYKQNGQHFAGYTHTPNENNSISILIALKFVLKGSIYNKSALVQVMAWRQIGNGPWPIPMMSQNFDAISRHI